MKNNKGTALISASHSIRRSWLHEPASLDNRADLFDRILLWL